MGRSQVGANLVAGAELSMIIRALSNTLLTNMRIYTMRHGSTRLRRRSRNSRHRSSRSCHSIATSFRAEDAVVGTNQMGGCGRFARLFRFRYILTALIALLAYNDLLLVRILLGGKRSFASLDALRLAARFALHAQLVAFEGHAILPDNKLVG